MDARTKALKTHRARLKRRGMKRLEVCVPVGEAAVIRKAASVLREQAEEAVRLRRHLGFEPEPGGALTALDIFAMPQPLSSKGEELWKDAMAQIERNRRNRALSRARKVDL